MTDHETIFQKAGMDIAEPLRIEVADPAQEVAPGPGGTAVLVCHGMGQQVPFETLEQVAEAMLKVDRGTLSRPRVKVRRVRCTGDPRLAGKEFARVEVALTGAGSRAQGSERSVHVYEAYWAPITQGKVPAGDVIRFLSNAALKGWSYAKKGRWVRWMFGGEQPQVRSRRTAKHLAAALSLVCSLLIIHFTIGAVAVARVFRVGDGAWPDDGLIRLLAGALILPVLLGALAAGALQGAIGRRTRYAPLSGLSKCNETMKLRRHHPITLALVWAALVATVLAAIAMIAGILWSILSEDGSRNLRPWEAVAMLAMWALAMVLSGRVRYFLVEYVGDVAAYVSHHTVGRFDEVRKSIQEASLQVGRTVYLALADPAPGQPRRWQYDRIIVVGHSLGSVVAYDTLNALIREDLASPRRMNAARRTALFLTFGSPLDKTAFIFRSQGASDPGVREVAAAAVQPMIQSYDDDHRPGRWVNIWSPRDWISGSLEYYDCSGHPPGGDDTGDSSRKVCNRIDPEACTPLAAHTEYWTNWLFAKTLHEAATT